MTAEEILLRDAFYLGIELKLFWFVALLYGISFVTGIVHLVTSGNGAGRTLTRILSFSRSISVKEQKCETSPALLYF